MSEQFTIPTPGDIVAGKYDVVDELGRGAYGVVFRAEQHDIGRTVALKTLLPQAFLQADIVQRFEREAQLISRLDHPNVIKLYDYGVDEGLLYMAVEYVEGDTLQDVINAEAPLDLPRVKRIVGQILAALSHAHAAGIVHRDLKPENIVLLPIRRGDGSIGEMVKVLDFGISKLVQGEKDSGALKTLTQSGTVLGTPHYMSPENIIGDEVDHTTDLYAVGILLYEMLVGEHPFEAQSPSAVMVRHLRDEPPKLPHGLEQSAFGEAIRRALVKQPLDRVQSAEELAAIIHQGPDEMAAETGMAHAMSEPDERQASPVALISAVGLVIVVLVVSIGWKIWLTSKEVAREAEVGTDAGAVAVVVDDVGVTVEAPIQPPAESLAETADAGFEGDEALQKPMEFEEPSEPEAEATASKAEEEERPRERRPTPAKKVGFKIESDPINATVTIDGRNVGSTPLDVDVESGDDAVEIRFSHIGYKNETVRVVPNESRNVRITLQKERLKFID